MDEPIPIGEMMERLRNRDEAAVKQLMDKYTPWLLRVVARRMPGWLRNREDPEDIVATMIKSLVVRVQKGGLTADSWDNLTGLVFQLTMCKLAHRYRDNTAGKRDARREQGQGTDDGPAAVDLAAGGEPAPHEEVELGDTLEWLMRKVHNPTYQKIVQLALAGESREEIAEAVGLQPRQVFRVLAAVREKLEERIDGYLRDSTS